MISLVDAYQIVFEGNDMVNSTSEIWITNQSLSSSTTYLVFYVKRDASEVDVTNITVLLPGNMKFLNSPSASTSVSNASFEINSTNNSIGTWYPTGYTGDQNITVPTDKFVYFNNTIQIPVTVEANYTFRINVTWGNGTYNVRNYYIITDNIPARIINFSVRVPYEHYNLSYTPEINISTYDMYLEDMWLYVVFKNSSKYSYYAENTSYLSYLLYTPSGNYGNLTFNLSPIRYVLKDKNTNKTYDAVFGVVIIDKGYKNETYFSIPGNFTNSSNGKWFLGDVFINATTKPYKFMYVKDKSYGRIINSSGVYYENGTPSLLSNVQLYLLRFNVSYGVVNSTGRYLFYTNDSFNLTYFLENISIVSQPLFDGNYSLVLDVGDHFYYSTSETAIQIKNKLMTPIRDLTMQIENNTRVLAKPYTYSFYLNDTLENSTCYAYFNYTPTSSPDFVLSSLGSGTHEFTYTISTTKESDFVIINLTCVNALGNRKSDFRKVLVFNESDIMLSLVYINKTYKIGDEINITYNVSNIGSKDSNKVNVTFKVCSDSSCNNILLLNYTELPLPTGKYHIGWFNYTLKDENQYYVKMEAYAQEKEFDYSNQNISLSIYPSMSVDINISSSTPLPGKNITIFASVIHFDGSPITTLDERNFTIYDYWDYISKYRERKSHLYLLENFNNGTYKFAYEIPNVTSSSGGYYENGGHRLILSVRSPYYKDINSSYKSYTLSTPFAELSMSAPSSVNKGDTATVTVTIKNTGSQTIDRVKVTLKVSSELSISGSSVCYRDAINPGDTQTCTFTIKGESAGTGNVYVSSSASETFFNHTIPGFVRTLGFYSYPSKEVSVVEQQQQQNQDTQSDTSQSNTQSSEQENLTSSSANNNDFLVPSLSLTISNNVVSFLINASASIDLTLKNNGNGSASNLKISLEYDKNNLDVAHDFTISKLNAGDTYVFHLNISSPTKRVGEYVVGITITYGDNQSIYREITVRVLPTEEKKREIEQLLEQLKNEIKDLKVPENLKMVYQQAQKNIQDAENKIAQGDYVGAYMLLEKAQKSVNVLKSTKGVKQSSGSWIWWIVGGLIVLGIIGGIAYYLLTPPKTTFHPEKGYSFNPKVYEEQRENYIKKLKESLQRKLSQ